MMFTPITQTVLQSCGVTETKQANQPQEEQGIKIIGYSALVRVDGRLKYECYRSYDERYNLKKTRIREL